jgi:hypothetical protein
VGDALVLPLELLLTLDVADQQRSASARPLCLVGVLDELADAAVVVGDAAGCVVEVAVPAVA